MSVILDHEGCISCGLCVSVCPQVFRFAADGKAVVAQEPLSEEEKQCSQKAAENCPVSVIAVQTGED